MCIYFKKLKINSIKKKLKFYLDLRLNGQATDTDIAKEIALHNKLAGIYHKLRHKNSFPNAVFLELESYRNAAALEDANARYLFAKEMLEFGKFWDELSQGDYSCNAHKSNATRAFEEAFVYLKASIEQRHPLAKRLYGMSYIKGWGVEIDKERGLELVIESIEQEGAWDKATEIFKDLGLNRPDFFSYMSSRKQKQ